MKRPSWWFTPAVVLAFLAGILRSLLPALPLIITDMSSLPSELDNLIVSGASIIEILASPVGVFIAGYVWASREDAESGYRYFSLSIYGAAVIGFVITTFVESVTSYSLLGDSLFRQLFFFVVFLAGLLSVPLAALAGVAVGHFRSA